MASALWTNEAIDDVLETLLPCQAKYIYERNLGRLSAKYQRHAPDARGKLDGDPCNRLLWGLAVGCRPYNGPGPTRTQRAGAYTYAEEQVIKWAFKTQSRDAHGTSPAAVASLLCRTLPDVQAAITRICSNGIPGFQFA